jgi:hypothetical protein
MSAQLSWFVSACDLRQAWETWKKDKEVLRSMTPSPLHARHDKS